MSKAPLKYTLVQHSGFGYGGDSRFSRAVEERGVDTLTECKKISQQGGLLYDTYGEAIDAAFAENYPPSVRGMVPRCGGRFARHQVDGLRLYLPVKP
jgi:hypothetical protein